MPVYTGSDASELIDGAAFDVFDMKGGSDTVEAAATADTIYGGAQIDWLKGWGGADLMYGGSWADNLFGGAGDDRLFGDGSGDFLIGEAGNDILFGGAGDDRTGGGDGNDRLFGGTGRDTMWGDDGDDLLVGGDGGSVLFGETGNDRIFGGTGDETMKGGFGDDLMVGGAGHDEFLLRDPYDDPGLSDDGNDRVFGGDGDDSFTLRLSPTPGDLRLSGGAGIDTMRVFDLWGPFAVTDGRLRDGTVYTGIETWHLIASVTAPWIGWSTGAGDDWLQAGTADARLSAGAGHDRIDTEGRTAAWGGDGDDDLYGEGQATLYGGAGNDALGGWQRDALNHAGGSALYGGAGDDVLFGLWQTADTLSGGADADTFRLSLPDLGGGARLAVDVVTDFVRGQDLLAVAWDIPVISGTDPLATGSGAALLFDTDTGMLTHDRNGSAAGGRMDLMVLQGVATLDAGDLILTG